MLCLNCDRPLPIDADPECAVCYVCRLGESGDGFEKSHDRMSAALRSMGWATARVEPMGGGTLGIIIRTDDDETDVLVSGPGYFDSLADEWLVRPVCQSHPEYDAASALPIGWAHTFDATAQAVSRRAILVAKYGPHACPDCA